MPAVDLTPEVDFLTRLFSIVLIDLVLSGDNAVVIGMAARRLSDENRKRAIIWGGVGAVILRTLFTVAAALLLNISYLQLIGGILLLWIAIRLIKPHHEEGHVHEAGSLGDAIKTIILADVVMSLDNILAVGGAARGHLGLLVFGLMLSIPILLLGSNLVAKLLQRFPILLYIGVFVLVHSAVDMIFHDRLIKDVFESNMWVVLIAALIVTGILVGAVRLISGGLAGITDVESVSANPPNHPAQV